MEEGVIERLVTGRDSEVWGGTFRVVTKEKPIAFPDQFKNFIRWSFGVKGREYKHERNRNTEISTRKSSF